MQDKKYSVAKALNIIQGFELRMRDFYAEVARKFSEPDDVRVFWESLSQQESMHATIIHTLSNMHRNNPSMFSGLIALDEPTIERMRDFLRNSESKLNSPGFNLDAALNEAFELETLLELNEIYDRIISSPTEPFRTIIEDLVESGDAHLNALMESIRKHATDPVLKAKAENFHAGIKSV